METLRWVFFLLWTIINISAKAAARPYASSYSEGNSTQIKIEGRELIKKVMNSTDILDLPIDANSEILTLETDFESKSPDPGGGNLDPSKDNMEAIMKAESDRDQEIVLKNGNDGSKPDATNKDKFRKQVNRTNTQMDDIVEAEQDRDESLASFNSDKKYMNQVAAKMISSDESNIVALRTEADYVELVEVTPTISLAINKSAYKTFANETGVYSDADAADSSFTDIQTLFLACFATLLPLLLLLVIAFVIRCLCRRWCRKSCGKSTSSSSCPSPEPSDSDDKEELQKDDEEKSAGLLDEKNKSLSNGSQPSTNGSIITMTLKNNHLIVETEETNDIVQEGIETRMKYSNDNDGIFVVKVQQSNQYKGILKPSPPKHETISNQKALIHREPEDEPLKPNPLSKTGLSISDLSLSSGERTSQNYTYSNETSYETGPYGYNVYAGYDTAYGTEGFSCRDDSKEPLISKTPVDNDKPIVTAAIFKQDSLMGNEVLQRESYSIEGCSDGPLLSDVQAREVSLQRLQEKEESEKPIETTEDKINSNSEEISLVNNEDAEKSKVINDNNSTFGVNKDTQNKKEDTNRVNVEKPKLTRADSLPVKMLEEREPSNGDGMDVIQEEEPAPNSYIRLRKGSLPIIIPEVRVTEVGPNQIDDSYDNENGSPVPLITVTEENEIADEADNKS